MPAHRTMESRASHLALLALVGGAIVACGDDPASSGPASPAAPLVCEPGAGRVDDRCAQAGFEACPDGVAPDGTPCGEPKSACPGGTAAFFGSTTCTEVGPGDCAAGFSRTPDGLGCVPILPTAACTSATRPRLGETSCAPVGDCAALFPPAGATYFVDDSFAAGQLDATHFATIQAAVAAAPSGATIAIDDGAYTGTVTLPKAVTLVGRCAAKVSVSGTLAALPGLEILSKVKTSVRGLTVRNFEVGVSAGGGADVTLEGLVLEANRRLGILGADAGTRVTARGSVIRGTLPDASGRFGHGAAAGFDGEVTIEDSAILDSSEIGAGAQKNGHLTLRRTVIARVAKRKANDAYGWGAGVQSGGQATITESAILDTFAGGVVAAEAKSKLRLERSYVRGVGTGPTGGGDQVAACALAQVSGALEVDRSTLAGSDQYGVFVLEGGSADVRSSVVRDLAGRDPDRAGIAVASKSKAKITASAIVRSAVPGLLVTGSVEATDLVVSDVVGVGVAVQGKAVVTRALISKLSAVPTTDGATAGAGLFASGGGVLEVTDVILREAHGVGLLATGAGTKVTLLRASITDMQVSAVDSGFGIAGAGGAELTVEDVVVRKARDIAVHLSDAGTVASLRGVAIIDTQPNGPEGRARSVNAQDGATVTLSRVLARGGAQVSLDVVGAGTRAIVEDSVFAGASTTKNGFGHGVTVTDSGTLMMTHSVVRDHAGIGFVFADASGSIASSVVRGNPIGVHTQQGVSLVEAAAAPAEIPPLSVVFTTDTVFEDNGSKTGSGEIPLPASVQPPR